MGAYGSPELREPPEVKYHPYVEKVPVNLIENICWHCGYEYKGNFCPICGTKAGEKKPKRLTKGAIAGLLFEGALLGALLFVLILAIIPSVK